MTPELRNKIIQRFHQGQSQRSIARDLQLSRNTVRRALQQYASDRQDGASSAELPVRQRRASKVDPHLETIRHLLARYPKITARRIFEELQRDGYTGGYSILSERVAELRPRSDKPFTERFETGPGVQAQMDYAVYTIDFTSEGRRRVNLFSYLLGYSRRQYLRFVKSQDLETTLREHIRAFEHLGGVAATCLYDNMKVVVDRWEDGQPIYNRRFLSFATHYGFRPIACRPRRPQTKGKVERPFDYVEKNLLGGREFRSLEHLEEVTRWWLAEKADVRLHGTTGERPLDRHAREVSALIALPQSPYEVAEVLYRVVKAEGVVPVEGNHYSVPWSQTHPGEILAVKVTEDEVIIYGRDLREIARHGRYLATVQGEVRQDPSHRPPREIAKRREGVRERFGEFGDVAVRFLEGLLKAQRQGWSQAGGVLELSGLYRRRDFLAALERAVRFGAYSLSSVRRILEIQARPKTAFDDLSDTTREPLSSLKNVSARPRPTSDYQQLLFPETPDAEEKDDPPEPFVSPTGQSTGPGSPSEPTDDDTHTRGQPEPTADAEPADAEPGHGECDDTG